MQSTIYKILVKKNRGSQYKQNWDWPNSLFKFFCNILPKTQIIWAAQWINKVLLYNTGNYIQYLIITYNGKKNMRKNIHITESLCCTSETNSIVNQLQFKKQNSCSQRYRGRGSREWVAECG